MTPITPKRGSSQTVSSDPHAGYRSATKPEPRKGRVHFTGMKDALTISEVGTESMMWLPAGHSTVNSAH